MVKHGTEKKQPQKTSKMLQHKPVLAGTALHFSELANMMMIVIATRDSTNKCNSFQLGDKLCVDM